MPGTPQKDLIAGPAEESWAEFIARNWEKSLTKQLLWDPAYSAATLPGDVLAGEILLFGLDAEGRPGTSEELIERGADVGGVLAGGTLLAPARGGLNVGAGWAKNMSPELTAQMKTNAAEVATKIEAAKAAKAKDPFEQVPFNPDDPIYNSPGPHAPWEPAADFPSHEDWMKQINDALAEAKAAAPTDPLEAEMEKLLGKLQDPNYATGIKDIQDLNKEFALQFEPGMGAEDFEDYSNFFQTYTNQLISIDPGFKHDILGLMASTKSTDNLLDSLDQLLQKAMGKNDFGPHTPEAASAKVPAMPKAPYNPLTDPKPVNKPLVEKLPDWPEGAVPWTFSSSRRDRVADLDTLARGGFSPEVFYIGRGGQYNELKIPPYGKEGAIFATNRPSIARSYGHNIYPVHLRMQNPQHVDFKEKEYEWLKDLIDYAKKLGHDSMVIEDIRDIGGLQDQYLVFDPAQVRSIWAKFDPSKFHLPDLMAGLGGGAAAVGLGAAADSAEALEFSPTRDLTPKSANSKKRLADLLPDW